MTELNMLQSALCIAASVWAVVGSVASLFVRVHRGLHLLQLDSYSNRRALRWILRAPERPLFNLGFLTASALPAAVIAAAGLVVNSQGAVCVAAALWALGSTVAFLRRQRLAVKKPLVFTGRAVRIFALSLVLATGLVACVALVLDQTRLADGIGPMALLSLLLIVWAGPLVPLLANTLLLPFQAAVNTYYVRTARKRLRRLNPFVVGITGSYGKTSTKHILAGLLEGHRPALVTPASFNTLLGVSRVVNEQLASEHKIFVVEMGAYQEGEIRSTARLVRPTIGILTAIGVQHLERFGTPDAICRAKGELLAALPSHGVAIVNWDDERCRSVGSELRHVKVLRYGTDARDLDVRATDIEIGTAGVSFRLQFADGAALSLKTSLLGRHNVLNILAAAAAARELGLSASDIARGVKRLKPIDHRLQPRPGANGVTVLDNAYSSNPIGFESALETLRQFKGGKKILVTPGLIELGPQSEEVSRRLAASIARVCDYVVLVGPQQVSALAEGLQEEGFPSSQRRIVANLDAATEVLREFLHPGDVVLFESDLPDQYAEV